MSRPANNFFKLEMLVLQIIDKNDCYGYQITQLLSQLSDDKILIKEGTLYPVLYRLMENDYISDKKVLVGKRLTRVYYHIEPKGNEYLSQLYSDYLQTIDKIHNIMIWEGDKNE